MQSDICELVVYTQSGAVGFEVIQTSNNFQEKVAEALESGTVLLELASGGKLILCAVNVVAIEIHCASEQSNTPPVIET